VTGTGNGPGRDTQEQETARLHFVGCAGWHRR
jgi:hypothetical protein